MSYRQALPHYASRSRTDFVKREWERPQFVGILTDALERMAIRGESDRVLRVVDIGSGAAEGYHLLRAAFVALGLEPRFDYWGIDNSSEMLALGRASIQRSAKTVGAVELMEADMRTMDFEAWPADIFLSIGAPYSHLEDCELRAVSSGIFAAMASERRPTVAIFDVLGRYSPEWLPLAAERSRAYEMSFFAETSGFPTFRMTFYSRADLDQTIAAGISAQLGPRAEGVDYWDRSIFVGRHTSTGHYNRDLPRVRPLVNALATREVTSQEAILRELQLTRHQLALDDAPVPSDVAEYLEAKRQAWNAALNRALEDSDSRQTICEALRAVEQSGHPDGVGVAHSLTACVYAGPDPS